MNLSTAMQTIAALVAAVLLSCCYAQAEEPLPVVASDSFDQGAEQWEFLDPESWKVVQTGSDPCLSQYRKESSYTPPHRSPYHVALLKGPIVGDFVLTLRIRSTHEDYPHRDACVFFGFQDAAHFYYVHLGKRADGAANQLFIVDGADRTKISLTSTDGTPWTDDWHRVKIVRRVESGEIEVYFDDMQTPAMTAKDEAFQWGRIGVGSFDDTADFDDVILRGDIPTPPIDQGLPLEASPRR